MPARTRTTAAPNIRIHDAPMAVVPMGSAGDTDRMVHAMSALLASQRPASAAEALRMLRRGYPDIPLAMRIAALCAGAK
jgi:hypothetical protein